MLIFTIPLALFVPEIPKSAIQAKKETIIESYRALFATIRKLRKTSPDALRFLIASAIYRDGLAGVFTYGAILGTVAFGFTQTGVIMFGIAANIVAGIGAFLGGLLDHKIGTKRLIAACLLGLLIAGTCTFIFAGAGAITYWVFGLMLCLFVGPAQASSRTFVARFAPENREGEVFGLYQTTGRAASFLSPMMWSIFISVAIALGVSGSNTGGSCTVNTGQATIYGILGVMLVLAVGLFMLLRVHPAPKVIE
jgi:UMF1 family MFS transporter